MTNNIQKAFKTKSKLRGMADGGLVDPHVLGSGMAQRAGALLRGRQAQIDDIVDAASRGEEPTTQQVTKAPAKKPEEKSALRSFFGLADGGQIFKNDVGGVPTFTDAKAATAGAKAYTPGQGGGTFSVVGMEPAQKQQMADAAAQRQAAASAPTTLGGRLDAALGKLGSPPTTAGAPSSTPTLGSELDAAIGRTQGVTSAQTPVTGAPREKASFSSMSSNANAMAAHNTELGLSALRTPNIPTDTVFPSQVQRDYQDFFGLADGGKVKGKGGPTDDEVGPVMLSHGEYVLPADTVDIVGRDKLDALRLATHDFVDDSNKPKVSGLRKMANGGPFYVDPEGVASRQMPPGRAVAPYQPPPAPSTAMAPRAPQVIDAEFRNVSGAAGAASPAATSSLRTAINSGGGRAGSFARGALPVAAIGGAVDSFADVNSGYRDKFNESIGATGPVSSVAGDAARVMGNVGDAITFGLAGRLGRGLSNLTSGQSFTEGFMSESDRDKYNREQMQRVMGQQAPAAAAATPQPQSYQSRRLAEMGVPVDQQNLAPVTEDTRRSLLREGGGTPGQYVNLGSYGGDTNIYGTASKPGGRIDTFTGVGASARPGGGPQEDPIMGEIRSALRGLTDGAGNRGGGYMPASQVREINKRYDDMLRAGSGRNRVRGLDWSQRHGLDVERARASELGEFARNQSALRGQDINASTAANNASMQALQTLGSMANQRSQQGAQAQAAQLKAAADAAKAAEARSKDAMASMNDAVDRYSAGDKDLAADLARVASTIPADHRAAIDALPASDRPGAWASVFDAYTGQNRGLVAGRDVGATVQNTLLGAGAGAAMPGIGRTIGLVGDLAVTGLSRGRYRGSVLRNLLGSRPGSAALGAGVGAFATPEAQVSGRLNLPMVSEDGLPIPADATFVEGFKHGFFDTNKPWAKLHRGENGELQVSDYSDDELAAIRDLSTLRRFGKE